MSFSAKQNRALKREVDQRKVRTRQVNGRDLSYLEGWFVIAEANRIFGFDSWSRETVEVRCVLNREIRGIFTAVYAAKVRVTVITDGRTIVREGHGTGEGHGSSAGETHDIAIKAAETDATKRALATFGKPFGLSLYLSDRNRSATAGERRQLPAVRYRQNPVAPARPTPALREAADKPAGQADAPVENSAQTAEADRREPDLLGTSPTPPSILPVGHPRRARDRNHLRFVAEQPCLKCARLPSDAHHLTFAQPRAMGMKVSDEFVVPLCRLHHREVHHARNERAWWNALKIDPLQIANKLWRQSHNYPGSAELDRADANGDHEADRSSNQAPGR
jgi:Rad52/22 family double-strand break repair protein